MSDYCTHDRLLRHLNIFSMYRLMLLLLTMLFGILPAMAQLKQDVPVPELLRELEQSRHDSSKIRILLELAETYVNRHGNRAADLDMSLSYVKEAEVLNRHVDNRRWEGRSQYMHSKIFRERGMTVEGMAAIARAKALLDKLDAPQEQADMLMEYANYYTIDSEADLKTKIDFYNKSVSLYNKAGDKHNEAFALKMLGDCYSVWGNFKEAEKALTRSLNMYRSLGRKDVQGIYDLLGTISTSTGNFSMAMQYGLLAAKTAEELHDTTMQLCTIYNRLGITYYSLGDYQEAMKYSQKALEIAVREKDTASVVVVKTNLFACYLKSNEPDKALKLLKEIVTTYPQPILKDRIWITVAMVKCHLALKDTGKAGSYIGDLLRFSSQMSEYSYYQSTIYDILIKYYLAVKDYKRASFYCSKQHEVCSKMGLLNQLSVNYYQWFKADSSLQRYTEAIRHYQAYKVMSDSFTNVAKSAQIAKLQIQYDIGKKDQDIRLKQQNIELLTRQALLQRADLKEATLTRNLIILGAVALLLLLIVSVNRYKLKQENNRQLTLQQKEIYKQNESLQQLITAQDKLLAEKEWLVKEIHHRVRNNLQIFMSLLNTQATYLHTSDALEAISGSKHRMHAISLIHQKLYLSENVAIIDMPVYIRELVSYLRDNFSNSGRIHFEFRIAKVGLDVAQAVPVALIMNEALINAIKYAFPENRNGVITIAFEQTADNLLILEIADSGEGFSGDFDISTHGAMGLRLIETLTEQLEGILAITSNQGVSVKVSFKQHLG